MKVYELEVVFDEGSAPEKYHVLAKDEYQATSRLVVHFVHQQKLGHALPVSIGEAHVKIDKVIWR